mgnify:CR=1 FL=1
MRDKRGFVSLFFLVWFLILSAWTALGYLQIKAEIEVVEQLEARQQQDLRLIPIFRWVRCQLSHEYRCGGWRSEIQAEVQWRGDTAEVRTDYEKIVLKLDGINRKVTNYEIEMR